MRRLRKIAPSPWRIHARKLAAKGLQHKSTKPIIIHAMTPKLMITAILPMDHQRSHEPQIHATNQQPRTRTNENNPNKTSRPQLQRNACHHGTKGTEFFRVFLQVHPCHGDTKHPHPPYYLLPPQLRVRTVPIAARQERVCVWLRVRATHRDCMKSVSPKRQRGSCAPSKAWIWKFLKGEAKWMRGRIPQCSKNDKCSWNDKWIMRSNSGTEKDIKWVISKETNWNKMLKVKWPQKLLNHWFVFMFCECFNRRACEKFLSAGFDVS